MTSQSRCWTIACAALLWATGCTDETDGGDGGSGGVTSSGGGQGGAVGGGGAGGGGGFQGDCPPGTKDGPSEGAEGELTPMGVDYNVRTPAGYDPTVAHPLIVVYAPAGGEASTTEAFTGLTYPATERGYVIAYLNHVAPSGEPEYEDAGTVPEQIIARWCIDSERVFTTGHSDGGSLASITGLFDVTSPRPTAIAPSAAGVSATNLASVTCPAPLPVMVIHSANDGLFPTPDFGLEPSEWWAGCASCTLPGTTGTNGCLVYEGCADGVEVQYCEGTGQHGVWPDINTVMLDFFDRFPAP